MKKLFVMLVVVASSALAACGGGSSHASPCDVWHYGCGSGQ